MNQKYLNVAVSIKGTAFAHPGDGSPAAASADADAKARGDYPYAHLYEGDDAYEIVREMRAVAGWIGWEVSY